MKCQRKRNTQERDNIGTTEPRILLCPHCPPTPSLCDPSGHLAPQQFVKNEESVHCCYLEVAIMNSGTPICNYGTNEALAAMAGSLGGQGMAFICLNGIEVSDASLRSRFFGGHQVFKLKALPKVLVALCEIERCPSLPISAHLVQR